MLDRQSAELLANAINNMAVALASLAHSNADTNQMLDTVRALEQVRANANEGRMECGVRGADGGDAAQHPPIWPWMDGCTISAKPGLCVVLTSRDGHRYHRRGSEWWNEPPASNAKAPATPEPPPRPPLDDRG